MNSDNYNLADAELGQQIRHYYQKTLGDPRPTADLLKVIQPQLEDSTVMPIQQSGENSRLFINPGEIRPDGADFEIEEMPQVRAKVERKNNWPTTVAAGLAVAITVSIIFLFSAVQSGSNPGPVPGSVVQASPSISGTVGSSDPFEAGFYTYPGGIKVAYTPPTGTENHTAQVYTTLTTLDDYRKAADFYRDRIKVAGFTIESDRALICPQGIDCSESVTIHAVKHNSDESATEIGLLIYSSKAWQNVKASDQSELFKLLKPGQTVILYGASTTPARQ